MKGVNMDSVFKSVSDKNNFAILSEVRMFELLRILFNVQLERSERDNIIPNLKGKELYSKI